MLICIEGIDGSGKGTITGLLKDELQKKGVTVATMSFPQYTETTYGKLIGRYLNGEFGKSTHPYLHGTLYSVDRFESKAKLAALLEDNQPAKVVILDRYVPSNLCYSSMKAKSPEEAQEVAEHFLKLDHLIFGMPLPDKIIYLDIDTKLAMENVAKKNARVYTDKTHDIHEADFKFLDNVNNFYRNRLLSLYTCGIVDFETKDFVHVSCCDTNGLRLFDCIVSDILNALEFATNG